MDVTIKQAWNSIKIYINGLLHLAIQDGELLGLQTWVDGVDENKTYHIQYYLKDRKINSCYWNKDHFEAVVKALDEFDLF